MKKSTMTTTRKARKPMSEEAKANMAATRKANKEKKSRMDSILEGLKDERTGFNIRVQEGKVVTLHTAFGDYQVGSVDHNHIYHCWPINEKPSAYNTRSFYGCNDGAWTYLLQQVEMERDERALGKTGPSITKLLGR